MKYITTLLLLATLASADMQLAPDGKYVDGTPQITPEGNYVGSGDIQLTPDGNYIVVHPEPKQEIHTYQLKDYYDNNTKTHSSEY